MNQQQITNAVNFIGKWLAISVVAYFGWTKLAPWLDRMVPF